MLLCIILKILLWVPQPSVGAVLEDIVIFIDDATAGEASASAGSRGPLAYAGGGALSSYGGADTQAGGVKLASVPLTGAYQPSNFGGLVRLQRGRKDTYCVE